MKLLNFRISNCFSYKTAELNLSDQGLKLVTGWSYDEDNENGSGKSSLVSKALCWWLYGRTPEGLKTDDVVNIHINPKGKRKTVKCWIEGHFIGQNGETYTLLRQRNPNKLKLVCGGNEITGTSMADTQSKIDAILGRDYSTFTQADLFGQGKQSNFFSLSPTEQRKVIESLLPIQERVLAATERAKEKFKEITEEHKSLSHKEELARQKTEMLYAQVGRARGYCEGWKNTHKAKISELAGRINEEAERVSAIAPQIEATKEELAAIDVQDTTVFDAGITKAQEWIAKYAKLLDSYRGSLLKAEKQIARAELIVNKWVNGFNCPTCRQQLPAAEYDQLQVEIEDKKYKLEQYLMQRKGLVDAIAQTTEYSELCTAEVAKLQTAKANVGMLLAQEARTKSKLNTLEMQAQDNSDALRKELEILNTEVNPFLKELERILPQSSVASQEYTDLGIAVHAHAVELSALGYWTQEFGKVLPLRLIEQAVQYLNKQTNQHLMNLQNQQMHTQMTLEESDGGDLKLIAKVASDTGGRSYMALSGGEKQIVNFAVGLALADLADNQVKGTNSVMILDEPFENLSARNADCVVTYLQEIVKNKSSVFVISHSDNLKGLITNQIHVTKRNGISEVYDGEW